MLHIFGGMVDAVGVLVVGAVVAQYQIKAILCNYLWTLWLWCCAERRYNKVCLFFRWNTLAIS